MPGIKNFSTKISVAQTSGELIGHLARRGVRAISTIYDEDGNPQGIGFEMVTDYGPRYFELPVRVDGVWAAMKDDKGIPTQYRNRAQAERTAWRIAKDWLEAQSALIDAGLATLDEVMMPYLSTGNGETLYAVMRTKWMKEIEA